MFLLQVSILPKWSQVIGEKSPEEKDYSLVDRPPLADHWSVRTNTSGFQKIRLWEDVLFETLLRPD